MQKGNSSTKKIKLFVTRFKAVLKRIDLSKFITYCIDWDGC